jgi:phosphoglycolate phosphatase-like HAD superfamily hydrolase
MPQTNRSGRARLKSWASPDSAMRLILFDIDGTLINSSRIGRAALGQALIDVFGTAGDLETYIFAGKTDRRIVQDVLTVAGWSPAAIVERLPALDERMASAGRSLFTSETVWPCPGVLELLDTLRRRDDVALALLTGNIRQTAPLKLAAAGVDPGQFVAGAYGSDSLERDDLFAIALQRAEVATGRRFTGQNVIVVGDTPADIRCARYGGGRAIAVATGPYSLETLRAQQPDHLFADLARTRDVLQTLFPISVTPV